MQHAPNTPGESAEPGPISQVPLVPTFAGFEAYLQPVNLTPMAVPAAVKVPPVQHPKMALVLQYIGWTFAMAAL